MAKKRFPLCGNDVDVREFSRFCQANSGKKPKDDPAHQNALEAITAAASLIYTSFTLAQEDNLKIHTFCHVTLGAVCPDCIIVGPQGVIVIEIKPLDASAGRQLTLAVESIKNQFPNVFILPLRATYRNKKKKQTISLREANS